jgi:hypothetical protein
LNHRDTVDREGHRGRDRPQRHKDVKGVGRRSALLFHAEALRTQRKGFAQRKGEKEDRGLIGFSWIALIDS